MYESIRFRCVFYHFMFISPGKITHVRRTTDADAPSHACIARKCLNIEREREKGIEWNDLTSHSKPRKQHEIIVKNGKLHWHHVRLKD